MWEDFKEFIARGNVLDLAIGVIIGAAFGTIVTTLTEGIIMPIVGLFTGKIDFSNKCWNLTDEPIANCAEAVEKGVAVIQYGKFFTDLLSFLIIAAVMFFVARWGLNLFKGLEAEKKAEDEEDKISAEERVLMEIRDILKNQTIS